LVLFFGVLLASVPWAALYSGPDAALGSLARVGLFGISVSLFLYLAGGPGRDIAPERLVRLLYWAGVGSAAFACLDFCFQFPAPARFAEQYVWLPQGVFRRAQGVFYEASTLGSFCVFLLVLVAAVATLRAGTRLGLGPWTLGLGSFVLLSALAFSFSRAAMVSLVVSLAVLTWLRRGRRRRWVRAAGVAAAAGLGGYAAFPDFVGHYWERLQASLTFLSESPNVVLSRRLETWQFVWQWISEHPWQTLWGVGYKTLPYTDALGRPVVVDNMYLSLLLETGWLGVAGLLGGAVHDGAVPAEGMGGDWAATKR
jgi:O-antigen ligase